MAKAGFRERARVPPEERPNLLGCLATLMAAVVLVILVILIFLLYAARGDTQPHPIPIPDLPAELATLPALAEIRCLGTVVPVSDRDFVDVWSHPGIAPVIPRDDSAYWSPREVRHPKRGRLLQCTEVEAIEYAWSELGGEFYVYVEAVDVPLPERGREFWERIRAEQAPGWVHFDQLDFK